MTNKTPLHIDWEKIRFRASSWGGLLTEPQSKAAKEAGELSETCKKALIKIYNEEIYGRKSDITTAAMEKGKQVEPDSIAMLSVLEGKLYYKNEERMEDDFFCGHPDLFSEDGKEVGDIKSSWSLDSFMPKLIEEPDKAYVAQLNVYYAITGAAGGFLAYCLVSAPPNILEQEKRSLLFKMNVVSELSPEYVRAAAELEHLLTFNDIPIQERVIKIPVPRDEELISKMRAKVPVMREWLHNFHKKHLSLYPKHELV